MGPRELALAIELNQQYVDLLTEMEDMEIVIEESETIQVML